MLLLVVGCRLPIGVLTGNYTATEIQKRTPVSKRQSAMPYVGFASKVFSAYLCGSPRLCGNYSCKAYKPQSRRGIAKIRREHIRHGQHVLPPSMLLM
jgi:hypothetical protein